MAQIRTNLKIFFFRHIMEGLFLKQRSDLENQMIQNKKMYETLFPNGFYNDEGEHRTLEEILQKLVYEGYKRDLEKIEEAHKKIEGLSHYWIGINPPPKTFDLLSLSKGMDRAVHKYKMFTKGGYMYCVEAHTKGGYRPHIHLMLSARVKPHRIIENLSKHFNLKSNSINVDTFRNNFMWNEHITYIQGDKREEKQDNVEMDNIEKENLGIEKFCGEIKKI